MVQPQNTAAVVDEFFSLLSLDPQQMVSMETNEAPPSLMFPCSLHYLATHYLDFMSVPRRSFFELLAMFTSSERERERLLEFSSTEGQVCAVGASKLYYHPVSVSTQEDYYAYCRRPRRTILEVLGDFPSAVTGLKLSYLLELIPPLQPRAFSIASSMVVYIHVLLDMRAPCTRLHTGSARMCTDISSRGGLQDTVTTTQKGWFTCAIPSVNCSYCRVCALHG